MNQIQSSGFCVLQATSSLLSNFCMLFSICWNYATKAGLNKIVQFSCTHFQNTKHFIQMPSCLIIYLPCLKKYSSAPWIGYSNSKSWLYSWNYFYSTFKHVLIVPAKYTMCMYYINLFYFFCIFRCHVHHHQGELLCLFLKPDIVIKLNIYCHDKEKPTINNISNSQLYTHLSYIRRF